MRRRTLVNGSRAGWLAAAVLSLLVAAQPHASAQEREHFQLKIGASYDQGDFGTSDTTRTVFVPVTLKYLGDRFDLGVTASFVHIDTEGRVTLLEGAPTRTATGRRQTQSGIGDTVIRGRLFLFDDPGPGSPLPSVSPFAKVKIPTADEDKGLGTGETDYGFGIELDKSFGPFFLFGDVSYTVIGSPAGEDFRNRPAASFGVGGRLSNTLILSGLIDWRRAIVRGKDDPTELVGVLTYRISPTVSVSPNFSVGLTDGSPDFAVGIELAYRFGRY